MVTSISSGSNLIYNMYSLQLIGCQLSHVIVIMALTMLLTCCIVPYQHRVIHYTQLYLLAACILWQHRRCCVSISFIADGICSNCLFVVRIKSLSRISPSMHKFAPHKLAPAGMLMVMDFDIRVQALKLLTDIPLWLLGVAA